MLANKNIAKELIDGHAVLFVLSSKSLFTYCICKKLTSQYVITICTKPQDSVYMCIIMLIKKVILILPIKLQNIKMLFFMF